MWGQLEKQGPDAGKMEIRVGVISNCLVLTEFGFERGRKFSFVSGKLDCLVGLVSFLDFCSLLIQILMLMTYYRI